MNMTVPGEGRNRRRFDSRDAVFWLATDVLIPITGFFIVVFLTRRLGPGQYGLYSMLFSIVLLTEFIISSICRQTTIKKVATAEDWKLPASQALKIYSVLGLVFSSVLFLAAPLFAFILRLPEITPLLRLYSAEILIYSFVAPFRLVLIARGLFNLRALQSIVFWVGRMILVIALVGSGLAIEGAILGNILALVLELVVSRHLMPIPFMPGQPMHVREMIRFAFPLMIFEFCFAIAFRSDLFLYRIFGGEAESLGLYAAAQMIAFIPLFLSLSLSSLVLSSATKLAYDGQTEAFQNLAQQIMKMLFWLFPLCSIIAGSAASVLALLFGSDYTQAADILAILCFLPAPILIAKTAANLLIANNYHVVPVRLLLPVFPAIILFNALLVPRYGAIGTASSILATFSITAVGFLYVLRKYKILRLKILDLLTIFLSSAGTFFISANWNTSELTLILKCLILVMLLLLILSVAGQIGAKETAFLRKAFRKT